MANNRISLSKKIYFLIRNIKVPLTTQEITDILMTTYEKTYGDIEQNQEWYLRIKNNKQIDDIIKDALWIITKAGWMETKLEEQDRNYNWTTYKGKHKSGTVKDTFKTSIRTWKVIK